MLSPFMQTAQPTLRLNNKKHAATLSKHHVFRLWEVHVCQFNSTISHFAFLSMLQKLKAVEGQRRSSAPSTNKPKPRLLELKSRSSDCFADVTPTAPPPSLRNEVTEAWIAGEKTLAAPEGDSLSEALHNKSGLKHGLPRRLLPLPASPRSPLPAEASTGLQTKSHVAEIIELQGWELTLSRALFYVRKSVNFKNYGLDLVILDTQVNVALFLLKIWPQQNSETSIYHPAFYWYIRFTALCYVLVSSAAICMSASLHGCRAGVSEAILQWEGCFLSVGRILMNYASLSVLRQKFPSTRRKVLLLRDIITQSSTHTTHFFGVQGPEFQLWWVNMGKDRFLGKILVLFLSFPRKFYLCP